MTTLNAYIRSPKHVFTLGASVALVYTAYSLWKWTTKHSQDQTGRKSVKADKFISKDKEYNVQPAARQSQEKDVPHVPPPTAAVEAVDATKQMSVDAASENNENICNTAVEKPSEASIATEIASAVEESYVFAEECLLERSVDSSDSTENEASAVNKNTGVDVNKITASSPVEDVQEEEKEEEEEEEDTSISADVVTEQFELLHLTEPTEDNSDDETNRSDATTTVADVDTTGKAADMHATSEKLGFFNDELSSHSLSAATSSNGDTDIRTPEHEEELNTNVSPDNHNTTKQCTEDASPIDTLTTAAPIPTTAIHNLHFSWNDSLMDSYHSIKSDISHMPSSLGSLPHILPTNESIDNALPNAKEHASILFGAFPPPSEHEAVSAAPATLATPGASTNTLLGDDENDQLASSKSSILSNSTLTATAPEFIPQSVLNSRKQQHQHHKKQLKKHLPREQLIEQQRQHNIPKAKARCSHWPFCTNNNCKFVHPYKRCRAGDECVFGNKCMFLHPSDL
ncbi:hypothetical protein BDF20DRAFT_913496 [Mycotypha africana]|uniref:uncharacterized protein n=1 Tax=Mycotypha africana TaxID=64632 RepID=UPI0023014401|nr:uncharacterized protein BDF20DRAFT_913496 [Mycotypha africana]KAI8977125.1 hypothetical protein BDF20DRAFT_913496 [Mycotypha africana]